MIWWRCERKDFAVTMFWLSLSPRLAYLGLFSMSQVDEPGKFPSQLCPYRWAAWLPSGTTDMNQLLGP